MIIDSHIHLRASDGVYDEREVQRCLALMDRAGIDMALYLMALGGGSPDPSEQDIRTSNDVGLRLMERHPQRFAGFCYVNPAHDVGFTLAEMDRCIAHGPMRGVKLWIAVHADDARLDPIMRRAAELDVPVLHHAWYKANGYVFNESNPSQIATLARRHPDVTIIMAHLTGCGSRGVLDIRECPNVVIDTSGGPPVAGLVEYAVDRLGSDRVVYGSDWPIRDFAVQRARVDGAHLSPEVRVSIMGGTMARLLKLEGVR